MSQQLQNGTPAPEPNARVRMLASVGPTPTDRTVYQAGSEWTVSLARAQQLEDANEAEILEIIEPSAPAPAEAVGDDSIDEED